MKVLVITGDKKFGPGHPRYELQRAQVEELAVMYWGRGGMWPYIPAGEFDVVTVQDPLLRGVFARHVAKKIGARFNVQVHMDLRALPWWKRLLAVFVLRRASSVRVVSERIKRQVHNITPRTPIAVLPVYVDVQKVKDAAPENLKELYPQFAPIILVAARLEPEKKVAEAIELMPDILNTFPQAGLLVAGEGSLRHALEQQAKKLGVEKKVIFLGHRSDIFSLYKAADVLLVTSQFESYGASIIEALAAGLAVVTPDVGVAREAGAIVVDRKKLAQAVVDVLQSNKKGELKIKLLGEEAWMREWQKTL